MTFSLSVQNLVQGQLVNGSIGQVVAFQSIGEARGQHTEIAEVAKDTKRSRKDAEESAEEKATKYVNNVWPIVRFLNGRELLVAPGTLR